MSPQDACAHELATLFAHMAQETGHAESTKPAWQTLLQYTREQNCYTLQNCHQYNSAQGERGPGGGDVGGGGRLGSRLVACFNDLHCFATMPTPAAR